jgi:dienelactone hydrolase
MRSRRSPDLSTGSRGADGLAVAAPGAGPPRRSFLGALAAAGLFPAAAAARPPANKVARVLVPGPTGDLHAILAIPGAARGRQPAVLVLGDAAAPDATAAYAADRLADAGLVACALDLSRNAVAIDTPAALERALAALTWLATNRYATGRVGILGMGSGATLAQRLAAAAGDRLTALASLGGEVLPPTPAIRAASLIEPAHIGAAWPDQLARAVAFLRARLI